MHVRDCFISHASEDKEAVARPLAHALRERGYEVWYDEFELEPGDSLPGKIDEGLAASRFGVVVLSEKFFAKNWTKLELDALVARQMIGSERIILPVWHGIDEDYLEKVSPTLASIVGVPSAPLEAAVERIAKRIDKRRDYGSSGAALISAQESNPAPPESDPEKLVGRGQRVKLGYSEVEKRQFAPDGAGGYHDRSPGWLSVIVGPARLRDDMIDPTEVPLEQLRDLEIDGQWYREVLCNRRGLRAGLDGFVHRHPEDPAEPPDYWLKIWQDGLLEYGESLALNINDKRVIPYSSVAEKIHDYVLLFSKILRMVGYVGDAVAIAALGDVKEFQLGLPRRYDLYDRPFDVDQIISRPLRASVTEMPSATNAWLKKTMDRIFLAAGISSGAYFIDEDGLIER